LTDLSPGALPGLGELAAADLVRAAGGRVRAKYGWTDVSRFAALGIPAVNLGPGDPGLAHKRDEHCPARQITEVDALLRAYLTTPGCGRPTPKESVDHGPERSRPPPRPRPRPSRRRRGPDHHGPASPGQEPGHGLVAHRPVAGTADPERVRQRVRRTRRAPGRRQRVRLRTHTARGPRLRAGGGARSRARRGRVRRRHRRRPG